MRPALFFACITVLLSLAACAEPEGFPKPDEGSELISSRFEEVDGLLAVEAEHYHEKNTNESPRDWYLVKVEQNPSIVITNHTDEASGEAYMEGLPDTRVTHDDSLIVGTNFYPEAGVGPALTYHVWFNTPGIYTVWVRAFSTGTEDNGIHAGIDGSWPESGQRVQWCEGKEQWTWSSAQRVPENHCGIPRAIRLNVAETGPHSIHFSMREDGFEFDKWIMALDPDWTPEGPGPAERLRPEAANN